MKINIFKIFLAFWLACFNLSSFALEDREHIVVGMAAVYAPFEYQDKGQIVGYDVDLIRAISKELGWKITLVNLPFDEIIPSLKRGKIDLAISAINVTPQRQMELDFSSSYYHPRELVWVYHQSGPSPLVEKEKKLKVGVQKGTIIETWTKQEQKTKKAIKIVKFDTTPLLFENLQANEVDAIVVEHNQAKKFCETDPSLTFAPTGDAIGGYALAFQKGSVYVGEVNKTLEKLKQSGFFERNHQKWLLKEQL